MPMSPENLFKLLDEFKIETPSWGYADTGTRFGKFQQAAAASTILARVCSPLGVSLGRCRVSSAMFLMVSTFWV